MLLASDVKLRRAELRALLEAWARIDVIGECAAGLEVLARVRELAPQVLILDVSRDASQAAMLVIEALQRHAPQVKIIALSHSMNREFLLELLRTGVQGCLSSQIVSAELVNAVEAVVRGQVFLCPAASDVLLSGYRAQAQRIRAASLAKGQAHHGK